MSHTVCAHCDEAIDVHWLFRGVFFIVTFVVAALTGIIVFADQGLYAAILLVSLPIGAIGYIKARFSPLVVRRIDDTPPRSPGGNGPALRRD